MSWSAVAIIGASLLSSLMSSKNSDKATEAQTNASRSDLALRKYMYEQNRSDLAPFRENELAASDINLDALKLLFDKTQAGPGDFKADPGYQFALDQGIGSLAKKESSSGRSLNADTIKFATGMADQGYTNFINRYLAKLSPLQSMAKVPTGATAQTVNAGQNYAMGGGNAMQAMGDARATGHINQANIWSNGINNALNNYFAYSKYSR